MLPELGDINGYPNATQLLRKCRFPHVIGRLAATAHCRFHTSRLAGGCFGTIPPPPPACLVFDDYPDALRRGNQPGRLHSRPCLPFPVGSAAGSVGRYCCTWLASPAHLCALRPPRSRRGALGRPGSVRWAAAPMMPARARKNGPRWLWWPNAHGAPPPPNEARLWEWPDHHPPTAHGPDCLRWVGRSGLVNTHPSAAGPTGLTSGNEDDRTPGN